MIHPASRSLILVALVLATLACGGSDDDPVTSDTDESAASTTTDGGAPTSTTVAPLPGYYSERYADPSNWICHPDLADDPCTTADLSRTSIDRDLIATVDPGPIPGETTADCFYLYPTVDLGGSGTRTDDTDPAPEVAWALAEAAQMRDLCRIYVPRYRQVSGADTVDLAAIDLAYTDVRDAFDHWRDQQSGGRPFVFIGHGQGADLGARVLQERVDADEGMRTRLVTAALLASRSVWVPSGGVVGTTFQNIPLCQVNDQISCLLAFQPYDLYSPVGSPTTDSPGFANRPDSNADAACTHPGDLDGIRAQLRESVFATSWEFGVGPTIDGLPAVETPYVALPEYFVVSCAPLGDGIRYLAIEPTINPLDVREPTGLSRPEYDAINAGSPQVAFALIVGDLRRLVEEHLAQ